MARATRSWRAVAASALSLLASTATAQTWSSCNPTQSTSCPARTALGMTISVDFTQGGVNSFTTSGGTPTYGTDGATFTVAKSGDSPQLNSLFYIMFGRVEVTMRSAPGQGIVSSVVLQSDDLDEIDFEWLGGSNTQVQTNYFGKGITDNPTIRGQTSTTANNQDQWITYVVDWTADRIIWSVGGTAVRTLTYNDAISGQYPQTPMQLKIGAWAGGDPSNAQGTINWAGGLTDYSKGPFSMHVKSLVVADYSTGKSYSYGDTSGTWQSIKSDGGAVNGRKDTAGSVTVTASAAAATNSLSPTVPVGGIAKASKTSETGAYSSGGTIPSGWVMTPSGKIVPASSTTVRTCLLPPS
ncbi:glycoside hydrolase family 16 protein [Thozetella sp. PMI_491]|nr:glycoside hydrolase family 16 protein [Thozetella sp. PMI_491]